MASGPATEELRPILAAAGPGVTGLLGLAEGRLAEIAAAQRVPAEAATLAGHSSSTLAAGGKRLRPLLVFLCGAPEEHGAPPPGLVGAACAVELVHMAALLHDDVLDRAALRRGLPTVYSTAGREAATATGDYLFACAFAELAETAGPDAVRALSDAATALVRGELMQRADAWSDSVTAERYLERCALKTASLFTAACALGAMLGDPGPDAAEALGEFGRQIGLAFQILDDVLDIAGSPDRTGKRVGTDILDGTITLPVILAREMDPGLRDIDLRAITEPDDAEAVCRRIAATGALEEARSIALSQVDTAKSALAQGRNRRPPADGARAGGRQRRGPPGLIP